MLSSAVILTFAVLQIAPFNPNRRYAFPPHPNRVSVSQRRECSARAAMALEKLLQSAMAGPEGLWAELAQGAPPIRHGQCRPERPNVIKGAHSILWLKMPMFCHVPWYGQW